MSPTRCTQRRLLRRGPRPYVAAAIKNALTLARRPPQVLLYFQSARLFQFHRLTWSFGDGVLLLHRNGSVFAERVHWQPRRLDPMGLRTHELHHLDASQPGVTAGLRQTLAAREGRDRHLNQSRDFAAMQRWSARCKL